MKLEKFNIANFHYLKHNLSVDEDGKMQIILLKFLSNNFLESQKDNPYRNLKSVAVETRSALEKLYADYKSEVNILW